VFAHRSLFPRNHLRTHFRKCENRLSIFAGDRPSDGGEA
jgi:hypothetical protein